MPHRSICLLAAALLLAARAGFSQQAPRLAEAAVSLPVPVDTVPLGTPPLVVNLKADGSAVVHGKPLTRPALFEVMKGLSILHADQPVVLRCDRQVDYQAVIQVYDLCQQANIWRIAFAKAP